MIYVSLVSSGLPEFETQKGIFRIWAKVKFAKMGGGERGKNFYWLEDVPYHMYFFQGYAIHGAYWHNNFCLKQSHGCVNISCLDARWFFEWTLPAVKNDKWLVNKKARNATWVWVHD
jgi:lipoprotein-anchoring transpeptidase ErfK/SrfK